MHTHTLQDVGEKQETQREEGEGETDTQTSTKNKERNIYTHARVSKQTDPERDKSRKRVGETEDIKMETLKRQTRRRRRKEME